MLNKALAKDWASFLEHFLKRDSFKQIDNQLAAYCENQVEYYPAPNKIFEAFNLCQLDQVKVVILGQDPYHGKGQANGLCFSVNRGIKVPPSLKNIFKELKNDLGMPIPDHGDLTQWAKQGVLLLNSVLTVFPEQAASHQHLGWQIFTDAVIQKLSTLKQNIVFILWGSYAQQKLELIDPNMHLVLKSAHPSPLSAYRGFYGNNHFSAANAYLVEHSLQPVDWRID